MRIVVQPLAALQVPSTPPPSKMTMEDTVEFWCTKPCGFNVSIHMLPVIGIASKNEAGNDDELPQT